MRAGCLLLVAVALLTVCIASAAADHDPAKEVRDADAADGADHAADGNSGARLLSIPEPSGALAILCGVVGLGGFAARRKRY